ncbi:hypothetical protein ACFE04_022665 [Oxalis oulophora]
MLVEKVINRSKRCSSLFHLSRHYSQTPNYHQDHAYFNRCSMLSGTSYTLVTRLFSSKPASCGNSIIGLQAHLRSYSTFLRKDKGSGGPRLNEDIQAEFVRLVSDGGEHRVMSKNEALQQARKLNLDLVEVQGNVEIPACKLMDFHKEQYKNQVKEKDRAKTKKSEVTLKSDCKEVRFSGKIEQKDLKMKADSVIRMLDRGYRVKCLILPKGKEMLDAEGMLSRISALVENVALVESGPSIVLKKVENKYGTKTGEDQEEKREIKQAFVIYRHMKFGPPKKGGAKKTKFTTEKPAEHCSSVVDEDCTESGMETEEDEDVELPTPRIKAPVLDSSKVAFQPESSPIIENRYKRSEPNNQFTAPTPIDAKRPEINRVEPQFPNQRRPPPPFNMNNSQQMRENNFATRIPNNGSPPQQEAHRPFDRSKTFNTPGKQGPTEDVKRKDDGNRYKSSGNPAPPVANSNNIQKPGGQQKFGIFSR